MAYKYQNEIEDAVDVMVKVMGEEKHGKAQRELAEVYRKAAAFDEVVEVYHSAKFSFNASSSDGITKVLTVLNRRAFEFKED